MDLKGEGTDPSPEYRISGDAPRLRLRAFGAGLLDPAPAILLAAALCAFLGLRIEEAAVANMVFDNWPLGAIVRHKHDDAIFIASQVAKVNSDQVTKSNLYILGGSSMREAITSDEELEHILFKSHDLDLDVYTLASAFRTFSQCAAILENIPDGSGIAVLGINFSRFAWTIERSRRQLNGAPLLLKNSWVTDDLYRRYGALPDTDFRQAMAELAFGRNTLMPAIAQYVGDYWTLNYRTLLAGRMPQREYESHRYTRTARRMTPEKKQKSLQHWQKNRVRKFYENVELNLAILRQLIESAKQKRIPILLVEQTLDHESIGDTLAPMMARYKPAIRKLVEDTTVVYADFEASLNLGADAFGDLAHLSAAPARLRFMRALAEQVATLHDSLPARSPH